MIEKVVVMNLEKRIDKLYFVLGALKAAGFPINHSSFTWNDFFVRSVSHDGSQYAGTLEVCRSAVADGFDYFSSFSENLEQYSKYIVAWAWTWGSTLRKIAELDKTVMLLIDDVTPVYMWTHERYCLLAGECAEDSSFKVLQLRIRSKRQPRYLLFSECFTSLIGKGFMGRMNYGLILNKAGAELLLDAQATSPVVYPNADMHKITEWGRKDRRFYDGLYHTLDPVVEVNDIGESDLQPPDIPKH